MKQPIKQDSWRQHGAYLGPTGPRQDQCWLHQPCYLIDLMNAIKLVKWLQINITYQTRFHFMITSILKSRVVYNTNLVVTDNKVVVMAIFSLHCIVLLYLTRGVSILICIVLTNCSCHDNLLFGKRKIKYWVNAKFRVANSHQTPLVEYL